MTGPAIIRNGTRQCPTATALALYRILRDHDWSDLYARAKAHGAAEVQL